VKERGSAGESEGLRREAERGRHYELQLRLYAIALQRLTGRLPDEAWVFFLRSGLQVPVSLKPEDMAAAAVAVRAYAER